MTHYTVHYPVFHPKSELRNGLVTTQGLSVHKVHAYDPGSRDLTEALELCAINSKGNDATGFIRVPAEEAVLRELAAIFLTVADQVAGKDVSSNIIRLAEQLQDAIDGGRCDQEDAQEAMDDLIYDSEANDKRASAINNQGFNFQIRHLIKTGNHSKLLAVIEELTGEPARTAV